MLNTSCEINWKKVVHTVSIDRQKLLGYGICKNYFCILGV